MDKTAPSSASDQTATALASLATLVHAASRHSRRDHLGCRDHQVCSRLFVRDLSGSARASGAVGEGGDWWRELMANYVILYFKRGSYLCATPWSGDLEKAKVIARDGLIRRSADEVMTSITPTNN